MNSKQEDQKEIFTQIIHLKKNYKNPLQDNDKNKEIKKEIIKKLHKEDISYKISKLTYFDVKKKKYISFGYGKIILKLSDSNEENINIIFYDSSSQLKFQGFLSIKFSSLSLDINNKNCILINKILAYIYLLNNFGEVSSDKILTNINLYFLYEEDKNNFIDSLIHFS